MPGKNACIVVDLRTGQHLVKIPDIVAVLAAAGWKVDVSLKEYGGETLKLAQKAARDGYDLILSYGGDGTLNAIFNGVMNAGGKSPVADIPGGTYNVWAGAIGIPDDPVKAALAIVNSQIHKIDLGHMEVQSLTPLNGKEDDQQAANSTKNGKKPKQLANTRQYFLLHVGMGIEAAMMAHISKPLKYHVGPLAFDLAALKTLPEQRPFPVEVQVTGHSDAGAISWQGEAWEVIISKVPLFGGSINIEPEARVDDGLLYVSVITTNGPLKTIEQAASIVLQHKLQEETTKRFKGTHFSIRIPATIDVHVDGSIVKLEDFLRKAERDTLHHTTDASQFMVTYHFDARPEALPMAIPRTYDGSLFTGSNHQQSAQQPDDKRYALLHHPATRNEQAQQPSSLDASGTEYVIAVIGAVPHPEKHHTSIIAGNHKDPNTEATEVFAVRVNNNTFVFNSDGTHLPPAAVLDLQEGEEIIVKGEKSKRNVIQARSVRWLRQSRDFTR
ncbi:MAG TPA: diacylglycerol kinase family protein [Ktedonobacteraceae bacterium]|nr:diacylglycerol kinase family protein [Ktedonobacteraceae bacterium]